METACLRHTEIPHTARLFSDFQYNFDRVTKYYNWWPGDPASYLEAAKQVDYPDDRRAALVAALKGRNGDNPSLDLLAKPGTVAVVTGQQVGLFSGPAYTIYKAMTAIKLAKRLTDQGVPAVPIFWLATEDHDLAEVNHSNIFGKDHQPVKISTDGKGQNQQPVGTIDLGAVPLAQLTQTLEGFPFGAEIADLVTKAYAPGATFGGSFEALLKELLSKWNILFLDPLDQAIRAIAAPFLRKAILQAPELHQKVLDRNKALEDDGYHAQVHVAATTSLFFHLEGERRITLKRQNGGYASKDRTYSTEELAEQAEQLSPNALLRPVVQDYLLPTVAYVGGPAELAYLAQSKVLYDDLLGRTPVFLARNGFTLLDSRANKLMSRYSLGLPCFFHGEDCLREKISKKLVPAELTEEFLTVEKTTTAALDRLKEVLAAFDPTLGAALEKSRSKVVYQIAKIGRKTTLESMKRDARATEECQFLLGLIYPEKHLQERFYSILPFLAKHGIELLDTLYEAVNLECPDHRILLV